MEACPLNMEEDVRRTARVVRVPELAGNRMIGGSRTDCSRWWFHAYGAPDGECDNMISSSTSVTNLLGVEVQGLTENSKHRLAEALGDVHFGGQRKTVCHHG